MRCSQCNEELEPGMVICPSCETPVPTFCPQCGKPVKPAWSKCPFCTAALDAVRGPAAPSSPSGPAGPGASPGPAAGGGVKTGDIGMVKGDISSQTHVETHQAGGATFGGNVILQVPGQPAAGEGKSPGSDLVKCPLCGKRNRVEDTFECRKCGRDFLCNVHFVDEFFGCRICYEEHQAEERKREQAEERRRREAEERARQEAERKRRVEEERRRKEAEAKARREREEAERKRREEEERRKREPKVYTDWPFDEREAKRRQAETSEALGLPVELEIDLGKGGKMAFVLIPAGEFMMGDKVSGPIHKVGLSKPFYTGKYQVTQAQWRAVTGENPSHFEGDQNPVEKISWDDCQEFLKKLNSTGLPLPMGEGRGEGHWRLSLPTEAQWEYACRAGSDKAYCFGDSESQLGDYAWFYKNSGSKTHPVGEKKPNAWGLYDLHGNVWEWCEDWSGDYPTGSVSDPVGPTTGGYRVIRGGGWGDTAGDCRSARRRRYGPGGRDYDLGFRLGLSRVQR